MTFFYLELFGGFFHCWLLPFDDISMATSKIMRTFCGQLVMETLSRPPAHLIFIRQSISGFCSPQRGARMAANKTWGIHISRAEQNEPPNTMDYSCLLILKARCSTFRGINWHKKWNNSENKSLNWKNCLHFTINKHLHLDKEQVLLEEGGHLPLVWSYSGRECKCTGDFVIFTLTSQMVQDKTDVRWKKKNPSTSASLVHVCRYTLNMSGHLFINNNNMPEYKQCVNGSGEACCGSQFRPQDGSTDWWGRTQDWNPKTLF